MSTAVVTPPVKKQSWLSKLGHDVLKVLGIAQKVEAIAEPVVEALLPTSIPAFSIFDRIISLVTSTESAFAAVGMQSNGPAKLNATLGAVGSLLDGWVTDNLPGGAEILKGEQYIATRTANATGYVNAAVAFLNSLPPSAQTATTPAAVAAAGAAQAAVAAKTGTTGTASPS